MNVKIDSGNIKQLQKSLLEMQKLKTSEFKKELIEQKKDLKEISSDSMNLKNLDAETSTLNSNNQFIDFNLVFNFFATIQVFVEGKINREELTMEICFKHNFVRELVEAGNKVAKNYSLELKMKATFTEDSSSGNRYEREDILKFIEKLTGEIFDYFDGDSNSLRALSINEKHFEKIAKAGKNELAALIQTLLGSVYSFIKYKEASGNNSSFYAQRSSQETKEYFVQEVESFSVEINQIEEQIESKKPTGQP